MFLTLLRKLGTAGLAILVFCTLAWAANNYRQNTAAGTITTFKTTDTSGVHVPHVNVDNTLTVDTTGLATSAKQDTGNTSLGSIDTKLSSQGTAANQTSVQAPVAPATATATKSQLMGCQATSAAINPTTGQQAAINCDLNNNLMVSPGGAPNLLTAQVSVATSDTAVVAARALRRAVTIQQVTGTQQVYCSNTTATSGNGILLPAVIGASVTLSTTAAVRCIALTGAQTVAVAETY